MSDRHPMTSAKLAALRLLATRPRWTAQATRADLIGGRVAKCLAREGLAQLVFPYDGRYEITDAGRSALELHGA